MRLLLKLEANMSNTRHDFKIMVNRIESLPGLNIQSYKPGDRRLYSLWIDGGPDGLDELRPREEERCHLHLVLQILAPPSTALVHG